MQMKDYINLHKGATGLFVLVVMAVFHQWQNPTMWIYLALHGAYGVLWVLKSRIFPDKSWSRRVSIWYGVGVVWGGLTLYWIAPVLLATRDVHAPAWYLGICVGIYAIGVFTHFSADMQKSMELKLRPGELITTGFFARTRNPNYFGELLIYLGFGMLPMHWLPPTILALFVLVYWLPRMRAKDRSLSRYPEFINYSRKTGLFLPIRVHVGSDLSRSDGD